MPGARTVLPVIRPAGPGMGLNGRVTTISAPLLLLLRKAF